MQYLGHTCAKNLFVVYLKINLTGCPSLFFFAKFAQEPGVSARTYGFGKCGRKAATRPP